MLDVPGSIAIIFSVLGAAGGALATFVILDRKVQLLQADCRRWARKNAILTTVVESRGRAHIVTTDQEVRRG